MERNQAILHFFRSKLNLNLKGKRVLDVGCGTAGLSELVTREGGAYFGCDFFEKILVCGQAFTGDLPEGVQASLVRSSAIELPFPDSSIDVAIGFDVIEHLVGGESWQRKFLREIRRVLRPDGLLLLTTPNRLCPFEGHTFLIGPQFLPISLADRYIRWLRPQFFREYHSYGEVQLLMPGRMKALLVEAGLCPLHELPWCTDRKSYRATTRFLLQICYSVGLGWAVFYKFQIAAVKQIAGTHPIWAGIGAYRLSSEQIVEHAQTARRLGVGGIILFSYDSLADATHGPGYVAQVGRAAFQ